MTGASRGIGQAIALQLARQGFAMTVHYHTGVNQASEVVRQIQANGGVATHIGFDIADRATTTATLLADVQDNGAFYGVVCNAGIARDDAFPAMSEEGWNSVIQTNLDGFYTVLHPLVMPMIRLRSGGRIVTLSSVSGLIGNRGQVNYSAAKAGIIGATKALAVELAKRKITVNCVAPGVIATEMTANSVAEQVKKMIPMQELGTVDDVAAAVGFLFSDQARYITRQVISVNGGMI